MPLSVARKTVLQATKSWAGPGNEANFRHAEFDNPLPPSSAHVLLVVYMYIERACTWCTAAKQKHLHSRPD